MSFRRALLTCLVVTALGICFLAIGAVNWGDDTSFALIETVSGCVLLLVGVPIFVGVVRRRSSFD
jgi:ACR3 family arsenite efflux pump ArsB